MPLVTELSFVERYSHFDIELSEIIDDSMKVITRKKLKTIFIILTIWLQNLLKN